MLIPLDHDRELGHWFRNNEKYVSERIQCKVGTFTLLDKCMLHFGTRGDAFCLHAHLLPIVMPRGVAVAEVKWLGWPLMSSKDMASLAANFSSLAMDPDVVGGTFEQAISLSDENEEESSSDDPAQEEPANEADDPAQEEPANEADDPPPWPQQTCVICLTKFSKLKAFAEQNDTNFEPLRCVKGHAACADCMMNLAMEATCKFYKDGTTGSADHCKYYDRSVQPQDCVESETR